MTEPSEQVGMLQIDGPGLENVQEGTVQEGNSNASCSVYRVTLIALIVSVVVLIVGIVLIIISSKTNSHDNSYDICKSSSEGARLNGFLTKIKRIYFKLHRHKIDQGSSAFNLYKAFNPKPRYLKIVTDASIALRKELSNLHLDIDKLRPRERKVFGQAQLYLQNTFGQPYGINYYAGDWMMGPNMFCMNPICEIKGDIYNYLRNAKPGNLMELSKLREVLKGQADGIQQYISNLKSGVKAGMVRTIEECVAGTTAIKQNFLVENGVLQIGFVSPALRSDFTSKLSIQDQLRWRREKALTVQQSIRNYIIEFISKPVKRLIGYLDDYQIRNCVPSSVSSGLVSLPLTYVYMDEVKTAVKTSKKLPTGEHLNGSKSYEMILSYFTTKNLTPEEINTLGHKQLEIIYPQVLEIARKVTKSLNDSEAVAIFRNILTSQQYQFSQKPFPKNESNDEAYKKCSTTKKAKQFCPKRWKATQNYWKEAGMAMNLLTSKCVSMFYFSGEKRIFPVCPVKMVPNFNPSIGTESYRASGVNCRRSAVYYTPFFLERFRPRYEVWSTAAHEINPGHHTQIQGRLEHFRDKCKDVVSWLDKQTSYSAFSEGWALYAENPLISETDIYDDNLMGKYGMLKAQIWRALRLIIDTGLHHRGLTRNGALALFDKYTWDKSDVTRKEVTRYQSVYGQATAYMIGRIHITQLRDYARKNLGKMFSYKEFHYQILSQGNAPLDYLTLHIKKYVNCVLCHSSEEDCDLIKARPEKTGIENTAIEMDIQEESSPSFNQMRYF